MTTIRDMSTTLTARATKTINETAIGIWLFFLYSNSNKIIFVYLRHEK